MRLTAGEKDSGFNDFWCAAVSETQLGFMFSIVHGASNW